MEALLLSRMISVDGQQMPKKHQIGGKRRKSVSLPVSSPSYFSLEVNTPARARKGVHFPISILLQQAITEGDTNEITQFLKQYGNAVAEEREPSGLPPIMRAIFEGQLDCLKMLVKAGADLTSTDPEGWNVLHVAAAMDDMDAAKYVMEACNVPLTHTRNMEGQRPIDLAESPEMASFLVHANLQDLRIETDLSGKTRDSNEDRLIDTVKEHYKSHGNCDFINVTLQSQSEYHTILHLAAARNYSRLARYLLQNCIVDPNCSDKVSRWTPVHVATFYGSIDVLVLLLENEGSVRGVTSRYEKPSDLTEVEVIIDILKRQEGLAVGFV